MAEVQVDQGVQLVEARESLQAVAGQVEGSDVPQTGVGRLEHLQSVVGQVQVNQVVQVLETNTQTNLLLVWSLVYLV